MTVAGVVVSGLFFANAQFILAPELMIFSSSLIITFEREVGIVFKLPFGITDIVPAIERNINNNNKINNNNIKNK